MNRPRPFGRLHLLLVLVAAYLSADITPGHAQGMWSENAIISGTMGVHNARIYRVFVSRP